MILAKSCPWRVGPLCAVEGLFGAVYSLMSWRPFWMPLEAMGFQGRVKNRKPLSM